MDKNNWDERFHAFVCKCVVEDGAFLSYVSASPGSIFDCGDPRHDKGNVWSAPSYFCLAHKHELGENYPHVKDVLMLPRGYRAEWDTALKLWDVERYPPFSDQEINDLLGTNPKDGEPIRDLRFLMPDHMLGVQSVDRNSRCKIDSDFASIDDSEFFIRALLYVPVQNTKDPMVVNFWVRVDRDTFFDYYENFENPTSHMKSAPGKLGNYLPPFAPCLDLDVVLDFGASDSPPRISLKSRATQLSRCIEFGLSTAELASIISLRKG
jgi:hypothetical protein